MVAGWTKCLRFFPRVISCKSKAINQCHCDVTPEVDDIEQSSIIEFPNNYNIKVEQVKYQFKVDLTKFGSKWIIIQIDNVLAS